MHSQLEKIPYILDLQYNTQIKSIFQETASSFHLGLILPRSQATASGCVEAREWCVTGVIEDVHWRSTNEVGVLGPNDPDSAAYCVRISTLLSVLASQE